MPNLSKKKRMQQEKARKAHESRRRHLQAPSDDGARQSTLTVDRPSAVDCLSADDRLLASADSNYFNGVTADFGGFDSSNDKEKSAIEIREELIEKSTEEGKTAMKRIRVECGVCKATRFYSIHRGITRIAGVVACEACRQFYQRFKKQPWVVDCSKGGKCYELDETPKNKCKACWVAHIICRCPVPVSLYNNLIGYLPTELKAKMAARPPTSEEVPEEKRGGLGLEVYKDESWVDVTDKSELASLVQSDDAVDSDEVNEPEMDVEYEAEEEAVDDPGVPDSENEKSATGSVREGVGRRGKKTRSQLDADPDERVMASLIEGLHVNNQNKFMENFNPKTSERVKRKKKKVQYFNSTGRTKAPGSQCIYGPDGTLAGTGKDLCDCLQGDCPGCHYPCPKCNSRKCGTECRMNRKWYYEKVEVEGTKLYWTNEWIKKPEK